MGNIEFERIAKLQTLLKQRILPICKFFFKVLELFLCFSFKMVTLNYFETGMEVEIEEERLAK